VWDAVIGGNNRYEVGCVVGFCYVIVGYYRVVEMWVNRVGVSNIFDHVTHFYGRQVLASEGCHEVSFKNREFAFYHAAETHVAQQLFILQL
jgi:hypothetical protein